MHIERLWQLVSKKLSGEATAGELTELEELLRLHPEMHYAIQHIQDLWQLQPKPAPETEDAFRRHLEKMNASGIDVSAWTQNPSTPNIPPSLPPTRKRPMVVRYMLAGLSFAAIVIVLIMVLQNGEPGKAAPQNLSEISTRNGSRTRINLPDGSIVWLNAGSRLVYDKNFDSKLREVSLTGEAYFDVVKNPDKPFIIHAGKMDIKVLGTLFNVKSYPGEAHTEASLIRGSIEVMIKDRPTEKIILKPNEKIVVANEPEKADLVNKKANVRNEPIVAIRHLNYEPKDSTIIETSWVENKLIFQDESFKEMAPRLERWYGVNLRFKNDKVQQLRFSGTFTRETIEQALAGLKITGGFNYNISDSTIFIY
jgi:transmembrane sensor